MRPHLGLAVLCLLVACGSRSELNVTGFFPGEPLDGSDLADGADDGGEGDASQPDDASDTHDAGDAHEASDARDAAEAADASLCRTSSECTGGESCCAGTCVDTTSNHANCGGCGITCPASEPCLGSACRPPRCATCPGTEVCCDATCVNFLTDGANCGGCGVVCGPGSSCSGGTCVPTGCGPCGCAGCGAGNTCCGSLCSNTQVDPLNCGACGVRCGPGTSCTAGSCRPVCPPCPAFDICCGAACINPQTDPNNCGGCSAACTAQHVTATTCAAGQCGYASCLAGWGDCDGNRADGCEAALSSDPANCGSCGHACPSGEACSGGTCQSGSSCDGHEGAFSPTVNPTYLSAGSHSFTTVNIPAGSVVYVTGGATLDICATGSIQIDGTLDLSGGPGTEAVIASTTTQTGKAGSGGDTGVPQSALQPTINCGFIAGVPGGQGPAVTGSAGSCTVDSDSACATLGSLLFAASPAQYGGGAGVFTGFRAYGSGGGGYAGGAPGALGAPYPGEDDCSGTTAGGGATAGAGGNAGVAAYSGGSGALGQTQCPGIPTSIPASYVGGGGGGSIGAAAASDLAVSTTFYPGSGGGGGSADYLNRPAYGGTSGGGGGGGALRLVTTASLTITGQVLANGGAGGDANIGTSRSAGCDPQPGAAGGGGSGGVIYLSAPSIKVSASATVSAQGGSGGAQSIYATGGAGGDGGTGRIRISVTPATCTLAGTFGPPLSAGCSATTPAVSGVVYVGVYPN